jgi:peptide/nickel transport system permease protein
VRGEILVAKKSEYVQAARALGYSNRRIIFRHILPNVISPAVLFAMSDIILVILSTTSLSFLGLGVPLPAPSWGSMLSIGRGYMSYAPWYALAPGTAIMLLVLGVYLLGDGLNHILDPRRQKRL